MSSLPKDLTAQPHPVQQPQPGQRIHAPPVPQPPLVSQSPPASQSEVLNNSFSLLSCNLRQQVSPAPQPQFGQQQLPSPPLGGEIGQPVQVVGNQQFAVNGIDIYNVLLNANHAMQAAAVSQQ